MSPPSASAGDSTANTPASSGTDGATTAGFGTDDDVTTGNPSEATSASDTSTGDDSSTGGPLCGNGFTDPGETCDDGNATNGDGCNIDCTPSAQLLWSTEVTTAFGLDGDRGQDVAVDSADAIFVVGAIKTPGALSTQDFWVGKYTTDGVALWQATYDGPGATYDWDRAWGVAIDSNDDAIVVGGSNQEGASTLDGVIRKYTSDGTPLWTAIEDLSSDGLFRSVAVDIDDDVLVGGFTGTGYTNFQAWMGRYTTDGVNLWNEVFEVNGAGGLLGLSLHPTTGDIAVSGYAVGGWLAKYDSMPMQQWGQGMVGVYSWEAVAMDAAGDVYVAGYGSNTALVRKYDGMTGTELWADTYTGVFLTAAIGLDITIDGAGDVVVVGWEDHPTEGNNAFVRKYTPGGVEWWTTTFNGPANSADQARGVTTDSADNIIVTGYATLAGGEDIWLAKFSP